MTPSRSARVTASPLDTVAQPAWRGVAPEDVEEITASLGTLLRHRTRRLLLSLIRPHTRALVTGGLLLLAHNVASMAGPYLVEVGIDRGIPPLVAHRGAGVLTAVIVAYLGATALRVVAFGGFIRVSGRMGQDFLFDLRTRLFDHFQRLSLSFHEHYTSGRVTSRLTSDIEAITELLDTGLQSLVTAALSIASTLVILLVLDLQLGLITLVVFSAVVGLTRWFRHHSTRAYRASRTTVALVIVHFVESLGGIRVVHAFRREARNREIMDDVNGRVVAYERMLMPFSSGDGVTHIIASLKTISEDGGFEIRNLMRSNDSLPTPKLRSVIDRDLFHRAPGRVEAGDVIEFG